MKKTPLIFIIVISTMVFTILGIVGIRNVYAADLKDFSDKPILSNVFTALNEGIYPWSMLNSEIREAKKNEYLDKKAKEEELLKKKLEADKEDISPADADEPEVEEAEEVATPTPKPRETATPSPTPTPTPSYTPRYEPYFETTYDEYITHISADIYGEDGVNFASEYEFSKVDIEYFDDVLFIGDSRTVGLRNYTDLNEHADFLCETSLTIWKALESDFGGMGTVDTYLASKDYGKIYIMVGVNELGTGTTEDFISQYTKVVDHLHEFEPDAKIIIQAIMHVDREKSTSDAIFNNTNIEARNHAIATLADNEIFYYIDMNDAVCDEEGFLRDDLRGDHLHLLGASNEVWKEFLLNNGVK